MSINNAIAYENYNHLNGMGFGLRAMEDINKNSTIIKMKTAMGFISNTLVDEEPSQVRKGDAILSDDELLNQQIIENTTRVSEGFFPKSKVH